MQQAPSDVARRTAIKVPQITVYFWITKVLTTGMGETASDYLDHRFAPVLAVAMAGVVLLVALVLQFRARTYVTGIYWFAVSMVSVFGTMVADGLHVQLGIPYAASTIFFIAALAVIFGLWYRTEKTLSVHSIHTPRREVFYWATVMATFALGTAAGDLTATTFNLGYFRSGVMFAIIIAIPALAHWRMGLNDVVAFWFAYIITRPLGASFADWMAVPAARGGLDWGTGPVTLVLIAIIVCFVGFLAVSGKDRPH